MTFLIRLLWFLSIFSPFISTEDVISQQDTEPECVLITDVDCSNIDIAYYFYNQKHEENLKNPVYIINKNNYETVIKNTECTIPNVDELKVLIHDLNGSHDDHFNSTIRSAYENNEKQVVLSVDYSALRPSLNCYKETVNNVPKIASCIAKFLEGPHVCNGTNEYPSNHVLGFGLGAQIAGSVKQFLTKNDIERITGLDPMQFFFQYTQNLLNRQSALQVDVVHTNCGGFGQVEPIGHVDFYPNGGFYQKTCQPHNWMSCSHKMSYELYADSIFYGQTNAKIVATSYLEHRFQLSLMGGFNRIPKKDDDDDDSAIIFGEYMVKNPDLIVEGIYGFGTNSQRPFTLSAVTDDDSKNAIAKLVEVLNPCPIATNEIPNKNIDFYVYKKTKVSKLNNETIRSLDFDNAYPLKLLVHGMNGSHVDNFNKSIREAYFRYKPKYNIISVDYSNLCSNLECYDENVKNVAVIANCIGQMLMEIMKIYKFTTIHAIGFCMGAQIIGQLGNNLHDLFQENKIEFTLSRATGLDPMLHGFESKLNKLTTFSAPHVDILHTNVGSLGQIIPTGHADFYVNNAFYQKGCPKGNWVFCSHKRAYELYAESIHYGEKTKYRFFVEKSCKREELSLTEGFISVKKKNNVYFGEYFNFTVAGVFHFTTNHKHPYTLVPITGPNNVTEHIINFTEENGNDIGQNFKKVPKPLSRLSSISAGLQHAGKNAAVVAGAVATFLVSTRLLEVI